MQTPPFHQSPTANSTVGPSQPWLFDNDASHHATPSVTPLQTFIEYNGPDEIRLGVWDRLQVL